MMPAKAIFQAVLGYKMEEISKIIQNEIDAGTDITVLLNEGLIASMEEVGRRFSDGEIFVPEMLMAAEVMKTGLEQLKPFLEQSETKAKGTVIIGTVQGDIHDIGKNLVITMLEGGGFKVIDLGVDVSSKKFVNMVKVHDAKIVAVSALLTTTLPAMEETVGSLKKDTPGVKIMVGGAPVTLDFAENIGADGYGADAPSAGRLAKKFLEG